MLKNPLFLFLLLILPGCATTAKYESALDKLIGKSEYELVSSWGLPDKQYNLADGKKAIEYIRKDTIRGAGSTYAYPVTTYQSGTIDGKAYSGTATQYVTESRPGQKFRLYCKTSFILDRNGMVQSWHHEGNDCVSR